MMFSKIIAIEEVHCYKDQWGKLPQLIRLLSLNIFLFVGP